MSSDRHNAMFQSMESICLDYCPICGAHEPDGCKCPRSDRTCDNGHSWHVCTIHRCVVVGSSDHGGDTYRCTCGASNFTAYDGKETTTIGRKVWLRMKIDADRSPVACRWECSCGAHGEWGDDDTAAIGVVSHRCGT